MGRRPAMLPMTTEHSVGDGQHLMLFDLYGGGHHLQYIEQLATYWVENRLQGRLSIVIPVQCAERWDSLSALIRENPGNGVEVVCITEQVDITRAGYFRLLRNDLTHGRILKRYIYNIRPDRCLLMYFDHVQLSLALGLRFPFPLTISGIYFRPTFHYGSFLDTQPTWKERLQGIRKRLVLKAALANRSLGVLYCLDPYVVPMVNSLRKKAQAVFLPDGAEAARSGKTKSEVRSEWRVGAGRKVLLLFGALDGRKGVIETLDCLWLLSEEAQHEICLAMVGPIAEGIRSAAYQRVEYLRKRTTVQFIVDDRFIPPVEVQSIVEAADLILITYQRHVGSSNVLVRAAAALIPVLASDYGMVGEQVRRIGLGVTTDTRLPKNIAGGIEAFVKTPEKFEINATLARCFAQENTAQAYARTILSPLASN